MTSASNSPKLFAYAAEQCLVERGLDRGAIQLRSESARAGSTT
jgi:hypothetical protein